jgi:FdhE protein
VTTDIATKILNKLKEQEKEEGNLPLLLQFYRKLLQAQSKVAKRISAPKRGLSQEALLNRLQKGTALLNFNDLELDWELLRDMFTRVTGVFTGYPELFGEMPEKLKGSGAGRRLTKQAVKSWFIGKELPPTLLEGVSNNLMQSIMQATLQPFIASHTRPILSFLKTEQWRRSYCPVCGGSPDLAFLEKEQGARWLHCSRCDSEWLYQRLRCPFCNNQDQETLGFFTDDSEQYRVYVCEQCKHYLKAVDLRKTESEVLMPLERFYTIDLDMQAKEHGYSPYL